MSYARSLAAAAALVIRSLERARVNVSDIHFGGAIPPPPTIRAPSFADTKFQAEQAHGDWAEACLASAINAAVPKLRAVHYGFSSKIIAGEPGFREEYTKGIRDTCEWGKRADLLLVPAEYDTPDDVSSVATCDTRKIVAASFGAVEVRSSRTEALRYMEYQRQRAIAGNRVDNPVPNFTVKIEDLMKVFRWIEVFEKPQIYAQVFLDVVYAINVLEIMEYIATADRLRIEEPQRSRKVTIYIPITNGQQIGQLEEYPQFSVVDRTTANGRHDIYAKPSGGRIRVDGDNLLAVLAKGS